MEDVDGGGEGGAGAETEAGVGVGAGVEVVGCCLVLLILLVSRMTLPPMLWLDGLAAAIQAEANDGRVPDGEVCYKGTEMY